MVKWAIKIIAMIAGFFVLVIALMAVFSICPPQGPWPMPPWCKGQLAESIDDLGCFPKDCKLPAGMKELCENYAKGNIVWPADCSEMPFKSCKSLCEREKGKTTFDATGNGCFPPKGDCWRYPDELSRERCEAYQSGQKVNWPASCSNYNNSPCQSLCESQKGEMPALEISTPVKLSNNPKAYRGWPWPHIFSYKDRLIVQYWGVVNDWIGNYVIEKEGETWTQPKELKAGPGTLVMGKDEIYLLNSAGMDGLFNLVVLDENFNQKKLIPIEPKHEKRLAAGPLGAIDSNGKLHFTWNTWINGEWGIKYATYDGNSVSNPMVIVTSSFTQYEGGATPWVVIGKNDVVYIFWVQSPDGKDVEVYYSYIKEGKLTGPIDLTNDPVESDCWCRAFAKGDEVHFFAQPCGIAHKPHLRHTIFKDGIKWKEETIEAPFPEGYATFESDKIHMVVGTPGFSTQEANIAKFVHLVYYYYFDGSYWHSNLLIPQQMIDDYERVTIDLTPSVPENEIGIAPDGTREYTREEHPEVAFVGGVLHVVFEYNEHGTYDAYYMTIKPKEK